MAPFMLKTRKCPDLSTLILEACGEFANGHRGQFVNMIRQNVPTDVRKVVVDASGLAKISAAAVAELAEVQRVLADSGCRLILVNPTGEVSRMLAASPLNKAISVAPTLEDALRNG